MTVWFLLIADVIYRKKTRIMHGHVYDGLSSTHICSIKGISIYYLWNI